MDPENDASPATTLRIQQRDCRCRAVVLAKRCSIDDALRESLNEHLERSGPSGGARFRCLPDSSLSAIRGQSWDARDMSRQIELNIGKDLRSLSVSTAPRSAALSGWILWLFSQIPTLFLH